MNQTIGETIAVGLQELITTVKQTAPEIWRIYIKQQYVDGSVFFIISMTSFYFFHKIRTFIKTKNDDDGWDSYKDGMDKGFSYIGMFIALIIAVLTLGNAIGHFINPEYYAIQSLLNLVRGGI